jgi:hypothetical protein
MTIYHGKKRVYGLGVSHAPDGWLVMIGPWIITTKNRAARARDRKFQESLNWVLKEHGETLRRLGEDD